MYPGAAMTVEDFIKEVMAIYPNNLRAHNLAKEVRKREIRKALARFLKRKRDKEGLLTKMYGIFPRL